MVRLPALAVCLFAVLAAGCAPSVTPLYRDFEPAKRPATAADVGFPDDALMEQLRTAAREAGWQVAATEVSNVVTTERRTVSRGVLSTTTVALDLLPIGDRHVRLLFHPRREYVTGSRTKVPYLDGGLRRDLLPPLQDALAAIGLVPVEDS